MAGRCFVPNLVDLLEETLERLETMQYIRPDDLTLLELKHSIVRTLAELEIAHSEESNAA